MRQPALSKALVGASTRPMILAILYEGENYGYQIIQRVKEISGGTMAWADNMLYPVLSRLEQEGCLVSHWKISDGGRLRKYYRITEAGRRELDSERRQWAIVQKAMARLWAPLPELD
jgi:PadR family transcriptional regulator, regulatory protein PadR